MQSSTATRHPAIDLLRTLAILGMIVFHLAYDLSAFYSWDIHPFSGGWLILGRTTACLFLLLAGISFRLSRKRRSGSTQRWKKELCRAGKIGLAALLVTLATRTALGHEYVRFGILHLIATGTVLLIALDRLAVSNILLGAVLIAFDQWTSPVVMNTSLLLPLGITYPGFSSIDYFPLLPWLGMILIGNGIAHRLYRHSHAMPTFLQHPWIRYLTWPGRHSLLLHLIHQPILLGMLGLMNTWIIEK